MNVLLLMVGAVVVMSIFGYGLYKLVSSDRKTVRRRK